MYVHFLKVDNLREDATSRDFASLKWFGSLFHKNAPLNSVVFNPYIYVLHLLSSSRCVFLKWYGFFA